MTEYEDRLALEKQRFDAEVCVHDLPEIFHYWSNAYLRPFINGFGYDGIDDFFVQEIAGAPVSDASYTCAGDTLTLVSQIGGSPATSVLHRG